MYPSPRRVTISEGWPGTSILRRSRWISTSITFDIDSIRKDLQTMIEEAQSLGGTLPVTARALECFDEASREGLGKGDATLLPVRWTKKAAR